MCHLSCVTCHMSCVTCHVTHVTCHVFFLQMIILYSGGSVTNVGLPRLVLFCTQAGQWWPWILEYWNISIKWPTNIILITIHGFPRSKYIQIFIRSIIVHPNIFGYSFGKFFGNFSLSGIPLKCLANIICIHTCGFSYVCIYLDICLVNSWAFELLDIKICFDIFSVNSWASIYFRIFVPTNFIIPAHH